MGREPQRTPREKQERERWLRLAKRVYNWTLWGFVVVLQLTQVLSSVTSLQGQYDVSLTYGRSPLEGIYAIPGTNDDPIADRTIVCSLKGRLYKPQQLSVALATANSSLISPAASSVNGYRVLDRQGLVLSPNVYARYVADCNQVAATLDNIRKICTTLGYNVSAKHLRVVVDHKQGQDNDASLMALPTTLPLLILPYWDNAFFARYAMPGEDGSACMFRLGIKYENAVPSLSELRTVDRSVRETKTAEWLNMRGGTWRHGWYELVTSRWYSDVMASGGDNALGIYNRVFDTVSGNETDCSGAKTCVEVPGREWWGTDLYVVEQTHWYQSVTITNGQRQGLFLLAAVLSNSI